MKIYSIGRTANNEIVLNDNFVSRKHAQLEISDNGQVMLKDLGSSNGTFVNGNRITESYLKPGDIVKCAAVFLNWQQYALHSPFKAVKPVSASTEVAANKSDSSQVSYNQNITSGSPDLSTKLHDIAASSGQNKSQTNTPNYNQKQETTLPMQQNVIVMGKAKSVGTAFLLAFFFGPLGLLYSSITGGVVMFILTIPIAILTAGIGLFFIIPICCIWGIIAANQANAALQNTAGSLINNNFQR